MKSFLNFSIAGQRVMLNLSCFFPSLYQISGEGESKSLSSYSCFVCLIVCEGVSKIRSEDFCLFLEIHDLVVSRVLL